MDNNNNKFYSYQRDWMYSIVDFMRSKRLDFTQDDIPDRFDLYQIYCSETFKVGLKIDSYTGFLKSSLFAFMQTYAFYLSTLSPDKFSAYCKDILLNGGLPYAKD